MMAEPVLRAVFCCGDDDDDGGEGEEAERRAPKAAAARKPDRNRVRARAARKRVRARVVGGRARRAARAASSERPRWSRWETARQSESDVPAARRARSTKRAAKARARACFPRAREARRPIARALGEPLRRRPCSPPIRPEWLPALKSRWSAAPPEGCSAPKVRAFLFSAVFSGVSRFLAPLRARGSRSQQA